MVTVGNSNAIWTGAGGLTISCSRGPFRTAYLCFMLIEHRYSLHSDRYARAAHICGVWAQHVQRCSEQASRYNIQPAERTGRLWRVTEQNKDGANLDAMSLKVQLDVQLEGWTWCSTCLSFFSFFLYYAYPIILNDRLCRMYLFFSAAFFTVLTARC